MSTCVTEESVTESQCKELMQLAYRTAIQDCLNFITDRIVYYEIDGLDRGPHKMIRQDDIKKYVSEYFQLSISPGGA